MQSLATDLFTLEFDAFGNVFAEIALKLSQFWTPVCVCDVYV